MSKCNHNQPCGCADAGLTTPPPCAQGTPECPDGNPCAENFDAGCIIYNGPELPCLDIFPGMDMQEVIVSLNGNLAPFLCIACATTFIPDNGATNQSLTPHLQWGAVPGATGYDIYFGTDPSALILVSPNQYSTWYDILIPLDFSTSYYWQVVPRNAVDIATYCNILQLTTLAAPLCTIDPMQLFVDSLPFTVETSIDAIEFGLTNILTNGISLSDCGVCCPECTPYLLGNAIMVTNLLYCMKSSKCCIQFAGTGLQYLEFVTMVSKLPETPATCCTDFTTCIVDLQAAVVTPGNLFINGGLVEYSLINDNTAICILLEGLQAKGLTPIQIETIMITLMDQGLLIACKNGQLFIIGIQTYGCDILHCSNFRCAK